MAWAGSGKRSTLILVALVLSQLVAVSGQVDGGHGVSLLERVLLAALSPFQRAASGAIRGIADGWNGYVDLRGVREENRRLRERLDALDLQLQEKQDRVREAERLRTLLQMKPTLPRESVAAEVVAREGVPWFRSLMVNQGSRAGVRLNAAALVPQGVVGRVVAVGPNAARVQLLLDRDCSAGVLVERSRVTGVVQGQVGFADQGTTDLLMKYVGALADVVPGDVVLTSGLDGIYPKGLMVGQVRSVSEASGLFKDVIVTPATPFDRIEDLLIVRELTDDRATPESVK